MQTPLVNLIVVSVILGSVAVIVIVHNRSEPTRIEDAEFVYVQQHLPDAHLDVATATPAGLGFSEDSRRLAVALNTRTLDDLLSWSQTVRVITLSTEESATSTNSALGAIDIGLYNCWVLGNSGAPRFRGATGELLTLLPHRENDNEIAIVDARSASTVQRFPWESSAPPVVATAFTRDGSLFGVCGERMAPAPDGLTGYVDGRLTVWSMQDGQRIIQDEWEEGTFRSLAFSSDAGLCAAGGGEMYGSRKSGEVRVFNTTTGGLVAVLDGLTAPAGCLAFGAENEVIVASGVDGRLFFFDLRTDDATASIVGPLRMPPWRVNHVAFSPDGKLLAVALANWNRGQKGAELWILDGESHRRRAVLWSHEDPSIGVAFSPDGVYVAAHAGEELRLWKISRLPEQTD